MSAYCEEAHTSTHLRHPIKFQLVFPPSLVDSFIYLAGLGSSTWVHCTYTCICQVRILPVLDTWFFKFMSTCIWTKNTCTWPHYFKYFYYKRFVINMPEILKSHKYSSKLVIQLPVYIWRIVWGPFQISLLDIYMFLKFYDFPRQDNTSTWKYLILDYLNSFVLVLEPKILVLDLTKYFYYKLFVLNMPEILKSHNYSSNLVIQLPVYIIMKNCLGPIPN